MGVECTCPAAEIQPNSRASNQAPVVVLGTQHVHLHALCSCPLQGVKNFSVANRFACLLVKFCEYSLAGITCGLIGQGVCNSIMMLKCVSAGWPCVCEGCRGNCWHGGQVQERRWGVVPD